MSSSTIWNEHAAEGRATAAGPAVGGFLALERFVDLGRGLVQQEDAAADEDHVAPREVAPERVNNGCGEADDPGDRQQQQDPHPHRQAEADQPSLIAPFRGQSLDEDRDEDDVVDAEDDLEQGQREKGDPGIRAGQQGDEVHASEDSGDSRRPAYDGAAVTDTRLSNRALPVLDLALPTVSAEPRTPAVPADDRLGEYLPDLAALPRFHLWTLGCQMNRSDSEEMAGRLLAAGCAEAPSMEAADLDRHQHLRDPRGCRAEGDRPAGAPRAGSRPRTPGCGSC